jgi:hypothetical protein
MNSPVNLPPAVSNPSAMATPGVFFWRLLYRALRLKWLRSLLAARYRGLQEKKGSGAARKFLRRALFALAASRWRNYEGYVPLQAWQAFWEIARSVDSSGQIPRRPLRDRDACPIRVGIIGMIAGPPYFFQRLFCELPGEIELHLFDICHELNKDHYFWRTGAASAHNVVLKWNNDLPSSAIGSQPEYARRVEEVARSINDARLDFLLVASSMRETFDVLDRVDVPFIADLTASSNVCFHPHIDLQFYIHTTKDYVVQEGRLFCRASSEYLSHPPRARQYCLMFDASGYEAEPVPWPERRHTVFFHGRLAKAAQPAFLRTILEMLQEDSTLTFVIYGMDSNKCLRTIEQQSKRHGVAGQVDFRGAFFLGRNEDGSMKDPDWHRFFDDLRHAKLAPTSFPMASGCARFESYAAGVPCVNLAIRIDNRNWSCPHETLVDIPALYTQSGTTSNLRTYRQLARRLLHDRCLAERILHEQSEIVARLGNTGAFWEQITSAYSARLDESAAAVPAS